MALILIAFASFLKTTVYNYLCLYTSKQLVELDNCVPTKFLCYFDGRNPEGLKSVHGNLN